MCTARQAERLAPLLEAYAAHGIEVARESVGAEQIAQRISRATGLRAVLAVVPRARAPRTLLPGPTVRDADGRLVPVGLVPYRDEASLARFARAARTVHARSRGAHERTVAILGQRTPRARDLASRIERNALRHSDRLLLRWTADEMMQEDLVAGMGLGLAMAVYVGHGRPKGWTAYRGLRAHHLEDLPEPVGAVISLTCLTASRRRTGLSFSEALVLQGSAAATVGAVRPTEHRLNARWAVHLSHWIGGPARTVADLVTGVAGLADTARLYRIIGDPLAPLLDAPGAHAQARRLTARPAYGVA
jgi:hypothetical protein